MPQFLNNRTACSLEELAKIADCCAVKEDLPAGVLLAPPLVESNRQYRTLLSLIVPNLLLVIRNLFIVKI